jgi:serine protease
MSYQKRQTLQQIKRLRQRADVEYAEPNYIRQAYRVPNDTHYNLQWHYPAINLPQAWDITTGNITSGSRAGTDVIVAVVDTGVYLEHPDFTGQLVTGYDFISDPVNAGDDSGIDDNPDDPGDGAQINSSSWHGTHVAATVAASSNNNSGVAGVAWGAKIMPLRVLGKEGGTSHDIIQSILYAARLANDSDTIPTQQADIINLSLGGGGFSQAEQDAYTAVRNAGVIIVAAAGNENTAQLSYPASYAGVISVSATDFANEHAPYSNFGTGIDVAAPGGNSGADLNNDGFGDGVLSAIADDSSGNRKPAFNFYSGTSMAAPHVAGVFALMRAVHPNISPDEIDTLLESSKITTDFGPLGRDDIFGHGLIDAFKAVQEAQKLANGGVLPPQPALITADPNQLTLGADSGATLMLSNQGGESASITSFSNDTNWLTVSPDTIDGDGLGLYQITIDRTGLSDSSYLGTITFNINTGENLKIQVSMLVGTLNNTGNAGKNYILLIDSNNEVIDQATPIISGNGIFNYRFTNVPAGLYQIVGGSDIDNDGFLCQLAETCGGYPTINALSNIEVSNTDISNLDFVMDILSTFGSSSLSSDGNVILPQGFQRLPTNNKRLQQ